MKNFGKLLLAIVLILALAACGSEQDRHIHKYVESLVVKEATCTEDGLKTLTCECGHSYDEVIPAEHPYDAGAEVQNATCTQDGVMTVYCNCGASNTLVLPAKGHIWFEESWDYPTCTKDGSTTYKCTRANCGETYTAEEAATGHNWLEDSWVYPTCTEDGSTTYKCTRATCEETHTAVVPATGHSWVTHSWVDETCTDAGWVKYICANSCGEDYIETLPKLGHNWSEWDQTLAPNVAMDGQEERYCYNCYIGETRIIEKLAGDFSRYPDFIMPDDWLGIGFFNSPDDIPVERVFKWAAFNYVEPVSVYWGDEYGETRFLVFKQEDLDAFTIGCLGRTYDYSQLEDTYGIKYDYDAEAKTVTMSVGGMGDFSYPSAYQGYAQLDETHYAIYYSLTWEGEYFQPGIIVVEVRDGNYIIVSHQKA